ncbi:MAG: hypothetical protein FWE62_04110 [Firmicutes bacterium]|nr:hypothetical protein [Bacillota bacterium]
MAEIQQKAAKKGMNRQTKKFIVIMGAILLCAAFIFGILALVVLHPVPGGKPGSSKSIPDADAYYVINSGVYAYLGQTSSRIELTKDSSIEKQRKGYDTFVQEYYKAVKFTALRGIFENWWFPSVKIVTEVVTEDGEEKTVNKEYNAAAAKGLRPESGEIMVVGRYNKPQTIEVKGLEIGFDHVHFFINSSQDERKLTTFYMQLVDSAKLEMPEAEDYVSYRFECVGEILDLYTFLSELETTYTE